MVERLKPGSADRVINAELGINWSNWDAPTHLAYSQRAMARFWNTDVIRAPATPIPLTYAASGLDMDALRIPEPGTERQLSASQLLERRLFNDALLVMSKGKVVHESYRNGMRETDRHVNHSTTKSLTTVLLGMAIDEGLVDPQESVAKYLSELAELRAWQHISVQHAMDMRTGLRYEEHYDDPDCICWSYFRATGYYPPTADTPPGYYAWIKQHMNDLESEPGYRFNYASPMTNALGLIAEAVYGQSVAELLESRVYQHIGAEQDAWLNLDASGVAVTEGQLSLTLRDFARWASLFLNEGKNLEGAPVVPAAYLRDILSPGAELREAWQRGSYYPLFAEGYYRNQTYVMNGEATQLAMLGIHGQFAMLDVERELLMVGYGSYPDQVGEVLVTSLLTLWTTLCDAYPP
ncbi:MAG: serine hydrolase [Pseudomonadota bacterium]